MDSLRGLLTVDKQRAAEIVKRCADRSWRIFELPRTIRSREAFFKCVMQTLPTDPPVEKTDNWDALSDSLWYGVDNLPTLEVLIVWPNATKMAAADPANFRIAKDVLECLAHSLSDRKHGARDGRNVAVLLVSE